MTYILNVPRCRYCKSDNIRMLGGEECWEVYCYSCTVSYVTDQHEIEEDSMKEIDMAVETITTTNANTTPVRSTEMTVREAGRLGGKRCMEIMGKEHYSKIGQAGGRKVREKYGKEFYSRIGRKGGRAVKEKLGLEFYKDIGKQGGDAVMAKYGEEYFSEIGKKGGRGHKHTS